jgi:hypothetical protein
VEEIRAKKRVSFAFGATLDLVGRGAVIVAMGKMCVQNAHIANFLFYPSI